MITRNFKYCPLCGSLLLYPHRGIESAPRCGKCGKIFYSAPHPTVNAIIVDEKGKILLTRRKYEPMKGYWDVPGGFVNIGESLEEGLRREIYEELKVEIEIERLIGSFPSTYGEEGIPIIGMFYLAKIVGGTPVAGSDVSEFKWFGRDKIPARVAFEDGRRALKKWREQDFPRKSNPGQEE